MVSDASQCTVITESAINIGALWFVGMMTMLFIVWVAADYISDKKIAKQRRAMRGIK
jgi:hypothetical protein